jgi:thiol-disulfide isomerase/thioredoxin
MGGTINEPRGGRWRARARILFRVTLLGLSGVLGGVSLAAQDAPSLLRSGTFTTVTGQVIQTDTLAGRVILVNAWATWCGPCVVEMAGFQRVQDELGPGGFLVIGISADQEGPEVVRSFVQEMGITYPVTQGPHRVLGRLAAQVRGLPTSLLLDRSGRLVRKVEGLFPEEELRNAVTVLLAEGVGKGP